MAFLLAALSSALYVLGYPGFGLWPLSCVALVPVLYALERHVTRDRQALAVGMCFGGLTQLFGTSWLLSTLREFSGLPWPACVAIFAALCAYQGGQLALFCWSCFRVRRAGRSLPLFAPLCLGASELVYPLLFPSPFGASLHAVPPLVQLAELGGPTLLSVLLAAQNAVLYAVLRAVQARRRPWRLLAAAVACATAVAGYGALRIAQIDARAARGETLRVGIVQADVGNWQKREARAEGRRLHLAESKALEHADRPELLIWPETALHYPVPLRAATLAPWLGPLATPVLLGALGHRVRDGRAELYNSAYLADAEGRVLGRTDKRRLIPFAEFMPFGERFPALYELSAGTGQFSPGASAALPFRGRRIAVLICYEDVLAGYVRRVVREQDPHLLVNLSNDGWFGRSREPHIHLALAQLRAIEHRRYLVRAGNTGVSAVIDPAGRIVAQLRPFERATLVAQVAWLDGGTLFRAAGDWPGFLSLLAVVFASVVRRRGGQAGAGAATSPRGSRAGAAA